MSDDNVCSGVIQRVDGGHEGRLRRVYPHPPQRLWAMLTEPAEFAKWIAPGSMDLKKGGRVHMDFADSGTLIDSKLTEFQPPRLLEYAWSSGDEPARPLRWELLPEGEGTALTLTVFTPEGEDAAKACAGFEGHLDMLAGALEDVPIRFPFDHFVAALKAYTEMLGQ